jgi:hypothetical protein
MSLLSVSREVVANSVSACLPRIFQRSLAADRAHVLLMRGELCPDRCAAQVTSLCRIWAVSIKFLPGRTTFRKRAACMTNEAGKSGVPVGFPSNSAACTHASSLAPPSAHACRCPVRARFSLRLLYHSSVSQRLCCEVGLLSRSALRSTSTVYISLLLTSAIPSFRFICFY